jgi:hypothetical protein
MNQAPSVEEAILKAIKLNRPMVLLLGQSAWMYGKDLDPVLKQAIKHLGHSSKDIIGWPSLLTSGDFSEDFYQWLAERFNRRAFPEWIESVLKLPWSGIFTSNLDPCLQLAFATTTRSPQIILTGSESPLAIRSRTRTPIYHFFGRAGADDLKAMPPTDRSTLRVRKNTHAIPMLNRIIETATQLGFIFIEGYDPNNDWLSFDDVLSLVDQMPNGHIIWFKHGESLAQPESDELNELASSGKILLSTKSLSSLVTELNTTGNLDCIYDQISDEIGKISFNNGESYSPTPEMRIRVESATAIVDDSWLAFPAPLGQDALYTFFRQFHGDYGGPKLLVEGINRSLAICREFEEKLWAVVKKASKEHDKYVDPIIVHGQSGTGKSISLARLVYRLKQEGTSAILYSTSRIPQGNDISDFCEEVEVCGAKSAVIVCDCNAQPGRYRDLLKQLKSRGRKVVVVGSSYRLTDSLKNIHKHIIEAPNVLSEKEQSDFSSLMNMFGQIVSKDEIGKSNYVLAALYRALPVSRGKFISGLGSEAHVMENVLRQRGKNIQKEALSTRLAEALIAIGLKSSGKPILENVLDDSPENIEDSAGRLIDYVMVAGRLNCPIPINLLMRAVSANQKKANLNSLAVMFESIDLFRWQQCDGKDCEELLVSPRIQLEADLICRRRLGTAQLQGERLKELISSTQLSWDTGHIELRFLIDLLHKLGPDGHLCHFFKNSYLSIARTLTKLREKYGSIDPRLMLQESSLRRAAIKFSDTIDANEHEKILGEARDAIQVAIEDLAKKQLPSKRHAMNNLLVERASIYGFLAKNCLQHDGTREQIWSAYDAARIVSQAAVSSTDTYYPLDVSLWIPNDLLKSDRLNSTQKSELQADIHSVLDLIDVDNLDYDQRIQFETRRIKLGDSLNIPSISNEAFEELIKIGSTAGYFLYAKSLGPNVGYNAIEQIDNLVIEKAQKASEYLLQYWDESQSDPRCLRYLLQCQWITSTNNYLLRGERQPLPNADDQRELLLNIINRLVEVLEANCDYSYRYLQAVFTWLIGSETEAKHMWSGLSRDSDNYDPRRIYKHHLMTDKEGMPIAFSGRIEQQQAEERWIINVEGLNRRITVRQNDFPNIEMNYGRMIKEFAIGFNYIGPVADPLKRPRRNR